MLTAVGRGLIEKSVAKGNMTRAEADGFIRNLDYLSAKYGFTQDQIVIVTHMETSQDGTINPRLVNSGGCGGLFQHCNPQDIGTSTAAVVALDAAGQSAPGGPMDRWLEYIKVRERSNGNRSIEMLYSSVYCPVAMDFDSDHTPVPPACDPRGQADALKNPDGSITRASMRRGLLQKAGQALGTTLNSTPDGIAPSGPITSLPSQSQGNVSTGSGGGYLLVSREACDQPWEQVLAHEWPGCTMKMLGSIGANGGSIGPPTMSSGANAAAANAGDIPYTGPITPGQFIKPIDAPITSGYGWRIHPILGTQRWHNGLDYGAPLGTPIRSVADGKVVFSGWMGGYGNTVQVSHGSSCTHYAHMSKINVQKGQQVTQGQTVGLVGSTGLSTGPHLHFEVLGSDCSSGSSIDPRKVLPK